MWVQRVKRPGWSIFDNRGDRTVAMYVLKLLNGIQRMVEPSGVLPVLTDDAVAERPTGCWTDLLGLALSRLGSR